MYLMQKQTNKKQQWNPEKFIIGLIFNLWNAKATG